jgi:hypothetical protein
MSRGTYLTGPAVQELAAKAWEIRSYLAAPSQDDDLTRFLLQETAQLILELVNPGGNEPTDSECKSLHTVGREP